MTIDELIERLEEYRDDIGGDTDKTTTKPQSGDWRGIQFQQFAARNAHALVLNRGDRARDLLAITGHDC